ncbi:hypothetical protein P167DRAFT_490155 [Morchella conica CCBAS932]|uniref:VASt domain-containing protein n=1 Tax=Morchella conica CCBAS932 TaxID=1392247 RepID=A0A3N4KK71_9PEZI|nr:hypothetical protein P167DRAFT_490155 [Morchella conica CCBAS932]
MPNKLAWVNTNLPAPSETSEVRPATSGGESRRSEDRGRRTGRTSVGTSDASEIPLGQENPSSNAPRNGRAWPGGIITKDHASPGTLADPYNPDGTVVQTTVTPPTPTDGSGHFSPKSPVGAVVSGGTTRTRNRTNSLSGTPSKLSQSMTAPLTPTSETPLPKESGSPGGTNQAGTGGFFQSMFSAAQTAATTISNSIANTNLANNGPGGRPRTATGLSDKSDHDKENIAHGGSEADRRAEPQRRLAVETLGHGELSLGSLGILPSPKRVPEGGNSVSRSNNSSDGDQAAPHNDSHASDPHSATSMKSPTPFSAISNQDMNFETAANSPINHTTRMSDPQRTVRTPVAEDSAFHSGSHRDSLPAAGTMTPERSGILATNEMDDAWFGDGDRRRSGSVKSSTGVGRKRGSSAASGGNVQPAPKPTGFAVASKKRNRDFHNLFRSVPEDDYLIEDYGCALQKEILLQGRFYVSEGHICFNSNIFGWINTLVISFDEVVSVEKKSTAMVFPNAIVIQTLHARHVFASFISRDSTYDLIVGIWRIGHPQLVANLTGVRLEESGATGEVEEQEQADGGSEYEEDEDEDEYEDDSDEDLGESYTDAGDGLLDTKANGDATASKTVSRKVSQQPVGGGATSGEAAAPGAAPAADYPGPATHPPTVCTDAADHAHYDKPLCDEIIPAPLGQVYSLAFGPGSYPFISRFLAEEEKVRSFSYIKPLGGPIGPKQTKCLITETIEFCDLEDHVSVVVATQTPDVPSGNVFVVKSKYCLMWGEGGHTRMIANCTVEWSGKSWLKGPIEKGASDGQIAYNADLIKALKTECLPKEPVSKAAKLKGKKKRKAMEAKGEAIGRSVGGTVKGRAAQAAGFSSPAEMESWGVFAPLKTYLGPVVDMIQPLVGGNLSLIIICVLVVMLFMSRRGNQQASVTVIRNGPAGGAQYWDQAWQREEEGLWEWLEDRSGLGGVGDIGRGRRMDSFERVLGNRRGAISKGMKEREVEEAIGIMEERLETLKKVVEGRKVKNPEL